MNTLYRPAFRSWSNGNEEHSFAIVVFPTREDAEDTARRYLQEVKGFCEYYCEYTITSVTFDDRYAEAFSNYV